MSITLRRAMIWVVLIWWLIAGFICRASAGVSTPYKILLSAKNPIVWQQFGTWLMVTEDLPGKGRTCYYIDPVRKSRLTLKVPRPGAWQPLGSAIKWLMYIDKINGLDRLMAHDVDHQFVSIACPSSQKQVGCGMADTRCIFGQYRAFLAGDHYPVYLYCINMLGGTLTPFLISDSEKSQFAHDGNLIVYRAYYGPGDVRICGVYFNAPIEFTIAARNGIEPSVCGNLVAWAEINGAGWNIVGMDISTGEIRTIAYTAANPPSPEAGKGAIFWQDARNRARTGIDIYGYDWALKKEFPVSVLTGDQTKLRVCNDLITWSSGLLNYQILWAAKYSR
ncbi:MAG: hypothetical protein NT018_04110 [Armatimonadetes bacterium]|nr:hypothetical protein [Armatimonadota bacterium]